MAAIIDIYNLALSNIGQTQINNPLENTRASNACNAYYNTSRDFVLQDYDWSFAERRVTLALVDFTPVGYTYAYALPSDWLKSRRIWKESEDASPVQFIENSNDKKNGTLLLTNKAEPVLIYTARITIPNVFSASFVVALGWKLAADIAFTMTKNIAVQNSAFAFYSNYMVRAENSVAESNNETVRTTSSFLKARK